MNAGRWVTVRGIKRWDSTPQPDPRPKFSDLIACPTCRATITQGCRSTGGLPREPHTTRLVSRRCMCGSLLARKKQMCETCREKSRARQYREREKRRPTAQRRRAA